MLATLKSLAKRYRVAVAGALLAAPLWWTSPALAADFPEANKWLAYMHQGRHGQLIENLSSRLQEENPAPNEQQLVRILLGKSYLATEQYAEAEEVFQTGLEKDSAHAEIWHFQKFRMYLNWGRHAQALNELRTLLKAERTEVFLPTVRFLLAQHFHSKAELKLLKTLLDETQNRPYLFLNHYPLAEKYMKAASQQKQDVPYAVIAAMWQHPDDQKDAEWSHKRLQELKRKPSGDMVVERMENLRRIGAHKYLIYHLPDQAQYASSSQRARLGDILSNAYYRERYYTRTLQLGAEGYFTQKYSMPEVRQLYWQARGQRKLKKMSELERTIDALEARYPSSRELDQVLLEVARYYKGSNRDDLAEPWWERLLVRFPNNRSGEIAAWELAWYHYKAEDYRQALSYINQGLKNGIANPEVSAKFIYWQAKIAIQEGKQARARRIVNNLQKWHPNTFYGMLARRTLEDFMPQGGIPYTSKRFWHDQPPQELQGAQQAQAQFAEFLLASGEKSLGAAYLRDALREDSSRPLVWQASLLMERYGEYRSLQTVVANHYLWDLKRQPIAGQRVWGFAFPRPHWEHIQTEAKQAGIDPYLALAIMREESLYQADAVSPAKARGLMQLMPYTARKVAKDLGFQLQSETDLFNPLINSRLGTAYLGELARSFDEVVQIAGGYNAGPGRMREWLQRFPEYPLDEFVESIPYIETRNYVKRVYRSYQLYKAHYESGA
jgi:soluble lytic murein transglycosylase-like protein